MKFLKHLGLAVAPLALAGAAFAQAEPSDDGAYVPEGYVLTGEARNCVMLTRVDTIDRVDERAWIVTMRGGDQYLNRVGRGCRQAASPFTYISYRVPTSQLCRGEIVQVVDNTSHIPMGSCALGEFESLSPVGGDDAASR